jgi:DNA processing protein
MTELESLIVLNMTRNVGSLRLASLLEHFGSARKILRASKTELMKLKDIGPIIAEEIAMAPKRIDIEKEFELVKKHSARVISIKDPDYPQNLKKIHDPPLVLYLKGSILKQDSLAIAVVGSRRASFYGLDCAQRIARGLANFGITVVSGLARGIDTASHKGTLKAKGRTIAVLGSGLARIYPPENKRLFDEISESGAVISEFPMQAGPLAQNFPRRNRIISGLSLGVVVVEAARNSGALITADLALEQGREVFAIPGKIDSSTSWGTNRLIKQGAKLVESLEDIIEELNLSFEGKLKESTELCPNLTGEEKMVYESLSSQPVYIDRILREKDIPLSKLQTILLNLEMKHLIRQLPGKRFVRAL